MRESTARRTLAFFPYTLKRCSIFFDINEATGFSIPFNPLICLRIKSLASFPYRSNTTSISIRFVYCHNRNRIYPPNYTAGLTLSLLTIRRYLHIITICAT